LCAVNLIPHLRRPGKKLLSFKFLGVAGGRGNSRAALLGGWIFKISKKGIWVIF
jgi:hypothetical protein